MNNLIASGQWNVISDVVCFIYALAFLIFGVLVFMRLGDILEYLKGNWKK